MIPNFLCLVKNDQKEFLPKKLLSVQKYYSKLVKLQNPFNDEQMMTLKFSLSSLTKFRILASMDLKI